MHDWPSVEVGEVPSPRLVAAWLVLGAVPTERVPLWAAHWIVGHDGPALAELAGLHGDDPHEVHDLLGLALAECGVTTPHAQAAAEEGKRAAAVVAFTAIAWLQVGGLVSERWVADKVVETVVPDHDNSIMSLPLGKLYGLDDEWDAGWGRTNDQLRAVVRQACLDQLKAASS